MVELEKPHQETFDLIKTEVNDLLDDNKNKIEWLDWKLNTEFFNALSKPENLADVQALRQLVNSVPWQDNNENEEAIKNVLNFLDPIISPLKVDGGIQLWGKTNESFHNNVELQKTWVVKKINNLISKITSFGDDSDTNISWLNSVLNNMNLILDSDSPKKEDVKSLQEFLSKNLTWDELDAFKKSSMINTNLWDGQFGKGTMDAVNAFVAKAEDFIKEYGESVDVQKNNVSEKGKTVEEVIPGTKSWVVPTAEITNVDAITEPVVNDNSKVVLNSDPLKSSDIFGNISNLDGMADNTFAMKLLKNRMKNLEKGIDLGIDDQIKDLEAKQNDLKIQIVADKVKLDDPAVKNNKKLEKIIQKRIDKAQDEFDKIEKKIKKLESENEKDVSKKDKLENVVEDIKLELNLTQEWYTAKIAEVDVNITTLTNKLVDLSKDPYSNWDDSDLAILDKENKKIQNKINDLILEKSKLEEAMTNIDAIIKKDWSLDKYLAQFDDGKANNNGQDQSAEAEGASGDAAKSMWGAKNVNLVDWWNIDDSESINSDFETKYLQDTYWILWTVEKMEDWRYAIIPNNKELTNSDYNNSLSELGTVYYALGWKYKIGLLTDTNDLSGKIQKIILNPIDKPNNNIYAWDWVDNTDVNNYV